MEFILVIFVLVLIFVPIGLFAMLSGIGDTVKKIQSQQDDLRRQITNLAASQKPVPAPTDPKSAPARERPPVKKSDPAVVPLPDLETLARLPVARPAELARETAKKLEAEELAWETAATFLPKPDPAPEPKPERKPAVPPAPDPQSAPSKFQESVESILEKIWNWILVGEEHRSKKVTAEYAIASVWLLRVGIIAVVTGIGFFLKLSIQRGWIGEEMRTAMSALTGIAMIYAGVRMVGKKYHILGQGFLGGGLAVLYFSAYAASVLYGIVPDWGGFVLLVLVTICAGILAVKTDSMMVAILGIIGGYVSPFFLNDGAFGLPVLYAYLLILSLGVLGVAYARQWRLLHYLAFAFTYAAYFYSRIDYPPGSHFEITITFLSLFFIVHSAVVYIYHLAKSQETTTLDILHLIANAAVYSLAGFELINSAVRPRAPAFMTLGLAAYCILHVAEFIRRRLVDQKLIVTLIGLAGIFLVWTLPIAFDGASLTIGFALMALFFVWLGNKMSSTTVGNIGFLLFWLLFSRLLTHEFPNEFGAADQTLAEYWASLAGRAWTFAISILSVAAAFYFQKHPGKVIARLAPAEGNDVAAIAGAKVSAIVFYWGTVIMGFMMLHLELNALFSHFETFRMPVLTALWCLLGAYLLLMARKADGEDAIAIFARLTAIVMGIVILKFIFLDLPDWDMSGFAFAGVYPGVQIFARLLEFGSMLVVMTLVSRLTPNCESGAAIRRFYGGFAIGLLFLYLNLELKTFLYWNLPGFQRGGISILWALFAIALIVPGILHNIRGLRYAGLAIFACTAAKVFLLDLAGMDIVFRVVAAIVIGIVLLLGSFAYIHSSARFKQARDT